MPVFGHTSLFDTGISSTIVSDINKVLNSF